VPRYSNRRCKIRTDSSRWPYDLYGPVELPPLKVTTWFNSTKFYEFAENFKETHESEGLFHTIGRWLFGVPRRGRTL
jgi:hypothetical protein